MFLGTTALLLIYIAGVTTIRVVRVVIWVILTTFVASLSIMLLVFCIVSTVSIKCLSTALFLLVCRNRRLEFVNKPSKV